MQINPYLLFPGKDLSAVPLSVLQSSQMFGNFSENGWMEKKVFQAWMLKFIDYMNELRKPGEEKDYALLILDVHSSRMDPDTLLTAACNCVIVLCGPSNLTNAWQPNDAGTNKGFKENLREVIAPHVEAKLPVSASDLAVSICDALLKLNMPKAIINSFRHIGIYPLDQSKIEEMIKNECANDALYENPIVQAAFALTSEKLESLELLSGLKHKRDKEEKQKQKKRRKTIDNSFCVLLTNAEQIANLIDGEQLNKLLKLKADDLHKAMLQMGYKVEEISKLNSAHFHPMKELHKLLEEDFDQRHQNVVENIEKLVKDWLVHCPEQPLVHLPPTVE